MCMKLSVCVTLVLVLSLAVGTQADLVGYWSFDEGAGTIAHDSSGNGLDGTLNGDPQWVAGQLGGALEFDGNDFVEIPHSPLLSITEKITITAWTYMSANASGEMAIVSKGGWAANDLPYELTEEAGTVIYWQFYDDEGRDTCAPTSPPVDEWYHIAGTYDGQIFKCYIDGELADEWAYAGTMPENTASVTIGKRSRGGTFFNGMIDEVAIYNHALTHKEVVSIMDGLDDPAQGSHPSPAADSNDVARDVILDWESGVFSVKHDVYFGTVWADVNDADTGNPLGVLLGQGLADSSIDAGRLDFSQTYFWRVDEVNGAPDFTVIKGNVWSFEVEPLSIPIGGVTVTASSSFGISGPEKTIDGSGLADDLHGVAAGDMWISGGIPATIEYAFDRVYKLHELWIWNSNQLIEAFVGFGAKDVVIEYSVDGENWSVLDGVGPLAQATGAEGYAHNTTIDFGGAMAHQVRLNINSVQGIAPQASLSEVRFYYLPVHAREPDPADGGTAASVNATLSWRAGREAADHEVVVSQDPAAVADGSAAPVVLQESSYTPDTLIYSETYYWQVTETNAVSTPPRYEGPIWSFSAPEYLNIDDFETYADAPFLEIWDTWIDGFDDPGNGATVGNDNEPEQSIVFEGGKSMPIHYDNSSAPVSTATRTFDPALDWTIGSPTTLSLHVRGVDQPDNDGQPMYVVITDRSGRSATVSYKDGDPTATLNTVFEPWLIPLADLAPVSLGSIESVTVGIGTPGGAPSGARGTVYVDLLRVGTPLP